MRPKTIRIIESIHSKGVFGPCSCGGEVLYYTDKGVRCSTCGKLYGVWANRQMNLIKRAKDLLTHSQETKGSRGEDYSERREESRGTSNPREKEDYSEYVLSSEDLEAMV
jgi:hypothetical protein